MRRARFKHAPNIMKNITPILRKSKVEPTFSTTKLGDPLGNPKDKIANTEKPGVYKISCNTCDQVYIGQTKRTFSKRYKEHFSHVKYNRPEKSAVAQHVLECDHLIDTNSLRLVKQINYGYELDAWESLYMRKNKEKLMNIESSPVNSPLINIVIDSFD